MESSHPTQPVFENMEKSSILKQLEDYGNLVSECNRYGLLERNAEQNRHTVRPHIYARVKGEYAARREALDREQQEQKEFLRAGLDATLEKRKALNRRCRQDSDRLEELDFRVRVGEFSEEEVREDRREFKEELLRITTDLADAQEIVNKFEQVGLLVKFSPTDAGEDDQERGEPSSGGQQDFLVLEDDTAPTDEDSAIVIYPSTIRASSSDPIDNVFGYLVALDGSRKGERFPLVSSEIKVGSSPEIDIRLADAGIARLHARIVYKDQRHYIETIEESGSCHVNGVQTDRAELKDGDVLSLGKVKMQIEYAREANA